MLLSVQLQRLGGQDVHTHPGSTTSSVETAVADDQLHNSERFLGTWQDCVCHVAPSCALITRTSVLSLVRAFAFPFKSDISYLSAPVRVRVSNYSQFYPPCCAETHSTGSHSAANRRAAPRHSRLSRWRRWCTMTVSSSGHSSGSWISLTKLAESSTVLLTGPCERIPSSSRNSLLQRTIEQLLEA